MAEDGVSVVEAVLPEPRDPRWRRLLLGKETPKFRHLVCQLMFSRVKMMVQADPSEASLSAAAITVRDFLIKNQLRVRDDVTEILKRMESDK